MIIDVGKAIATLTAKDLIHHNKKPSENPLFTSVTKSDIMNPIETAIIAANKNGANFLFIGCLPCVCK